MYLFGVKYSYNLDRLQIACCHLIREEISLVSKRGHFPGARSLHTLCFYRYCSTFFQKQVTINKFWGTCGRTLAFHLSVNGQKSVRARVTLFHQLQAKHQIPIKKSIKHKLMTT